MSPRRLVFLLLVAIVVGVPALVWLGRDDDPAAPPRGGATHPAELATLVQQVLAARDAGDDVRLHDLLYAMLPTEEDLRQVLRPGADTDAFLAARRGPLPPRENPEAMATLASQVLVPSSPEQRIVKAHAATTEALIEADRGRGVPEFPGGMGRFARRIAAPGRTWWVVELLVPGKEDGMKYTCFTRLGERWIIVPKPWRHLPGD